jgi:hypothetical protein
MLGMVLLCAEKLVTQSLLAASAVLMAGSKKERKRAV